MEQRKAGERGGKGGSKEKGGGRNREGRQEPLRHMERGREEEGGNNDRKQARGQRLIAGAINPLPAPLKAPRLKVSDASTQQEMQWPRLPSQTSVTDLESAEESQAAGWQISEWHAQVVLEVPQDPPQDL